MGHQWLRILSTSECWEILMWLGEEIETNNLQLPALKALVQGTKTLNTSAGPYSSNKVNRGQVEDAAHVIRALKQNDRQRSQGPDSFHMHCSSTTTASVKAVQMDTHGCAWPRAGGTSQNEEKVKIWPAKVQMHSWEMLNASIPSSSWAFRCNGQNSSIPQGKIDLHHLSLT